MIRSDLAEKLALRMNISKLEADRLVLAFCDAIEANLKIDGKVAIQGFGSFVLKEYQPRVGKKPVSGEEIEIPARKKPAFRPSKDLLQLINTEREPRIITQVEDSPGISASL